jgi:hypothetical protein
LFSVEIKKNFFAKSQIKFSLGKIKIKKFQRNMSFITNYDNLYKAIIRPPRSQYNENDLGIKKSYD